VADRLLEVFATGLGMSPGDLSDETNPDNTPQWDSLAAMELVTLLEESFDIRLKTGDIMKMRSIGIARAVLRDKGVEGL
jgi:acyl carrier protein